MMNSLQIRYFMTAAEEKNFTAAAAKLFLTQQNLSLNIGNLERELGVKLFYRTRPMKLTPAGEQLYHRCEELLYLQEQIEREIRDISQAESGTLRIGVCFAHARAFLPQILKKFNASCPKVKVEIWESDIQGINAMLEHHKVDIAVSRPPFPHGIQSLPMFADRLYLYAPSNSLKLIYGEVIPQNKSVLDFLRECPLILPRNGTTRNILAKIFYENNIVPNIHIETDSLETALAICRQGIGITVTPLMLLSEEERVAEASKEFKELYLLETQWPDLELCFPEQSYQTIAVRRFLEASNSCVI